MLGSFLYLLVKHFVRLSLKLCYEKAISYIFIYILINLHISLIDHILSTWRILLSNRPLPCRWSAFLPWLLLNFQLFSMGISSNRVLNPEHCLHLTPAIQQSNEALLFTLLGQEPAPTSSLFVTRHVLTPATVLAFTTAAAARQSSWMFRAREPCPYSRYFPLPRI